MFTFLFVVCAYLLICGLHALNEYLFEEEE